MIQPDTHADDGEAIGPSPHTEAPAEPHPKPDDGGEMKRAQSQPCAEGTNGLPETTAEPSAAERPDRKVHWRCWHCGDTFTKAQARWARQHFGRDEGELPVCQMRLPGEHHLLTLLRKAQDELAAYQAEDSDLMRAIYAMQADHAAALRREEERGYEKGVADARAEASPLGAELGSSSSQSQPIVASNGHTEAEPSAALARRRLEHVAKAIWLAEWEEEFPPPGTITHALAMQMAVAATEALAQAMEMVAP